MVIVDRENSLILVEEMLDGTVLGLLLNEAGDLVK
jgi:hypothetical protein